MEKKAGIYKISSKVDGRVYVGSSQNMYKRKQQHLSTLRRQVHDNRNIQEIFDEHGDCFEFEVLEKCEEEMLTEREQYYLDELKPELNVATKALNNSGVVYTKETRRKMSDARKKFFENGGKPWNLGRIKPQEEKDKISKSLKKWHRENPHPFKGKTHTEEARQKCIAASRRRKGTHNKSKHGGVAKMDKETLEVLEVYKSCGEAAKYIKTNGNLKTVRTKIAESITHDRNAYSYKWAYIKDLDQKKLDELLET